MTAPYPYQQQPSGGASAIALTTKFFPLMFIFFFIKPFISINGQQVPEIKWGRTVIPVQPGQYHLHVHVPYFLPAKVGPADLPVSVMPGQTLELEYRAPAWAFLQGSLGAPPQQYNGMWIQWLVLGISALVIVCCCLGTVVSNMN